MKRVIIISPNPASFYTTSVCEMLLRENIIIQAVIVKKFSIKRFKEEFQRDGLRLLKKIWRKLILRSKSYSVNLDNSIIGYRERNKIELKNVNELKKSNIKIFSVEDINNEKTIEMFKRLKPDLVVFTGGGMIKQGLLENSGAGIVNCHMGILPNYRGMDVVESAILNNEYDHIGLTTHFMEKSVDTGAIISRYPISICGKETVRSLRDRLEFHMVDAMVNSVLELLNGEVKVTDQSLEDGKQFFVLDKALEQIASNKLETYSSFLNNA